MKTRNKRSLRRLLIKMTYCCASYIDQACQIERAVARRPARLQIDMAGTDEIPPDMALLMRSILLKRSPETHLITNARSSLQGGAVLVWLLGDTRLIREDARLYFRRSHPQDEEHWKDEEAQDAEVNLEELDYAQVLQHINSFLPVKELAGRPLDLKVLRQFGLVDNEAVDRFLATAFAKSVTSTEDSRAGPEATHSEPASKAPHSDQSEA
jgi:hypothetical protein